MSSLSNLDKITAGKVKTSGVSAFNELEISKVYPNPDQPRKQFDDIEGLAATILEHGLLQPITVVKKDNGYMIIAGERRYKAHLHNEAKTIKAYIVDVSEEQVEELTLIENIQRNDLTDFEIAKHICKLWDSGRYEKKSDLATKIGKSDSYISKSFNCLKLDSEILEDIEQNKKDIPISVMDEIARVKDPVVQKEVYEKYNNKEITRDEIKDFKEQKKTLIDKFEDADNDLVEQAKNFTEYFPRENEESKSYPYNYPHWRYFVHSEHIQKELDKAPLLKHLWGKLKDGTHYKLIIHEQSDSENKDTNDHIDFIKDCVEMNGYVTDTEFFPKTLTAPGRHTVLKNRYEEIIFDLLKENFELKQNKPTPKEKALIKDDEPKEIKLLELNENDVYIEYMDNESEHISYNKAKTLIKNSKKEYIKYENTGSEKACNFLNTLPKDILKTGGYLKKQYRF